MASQRPENLEALRPVVLPRDGAFVIQLAPGSAAGIGCWQGRIEHVSSGSAAFFNSLEQLICVVHSILEGVPTFQAFKTPVASVGDDGSGAGAVAD